MIKGKPSKPHYSSQKLLKGNPWNHIIQAEEPDFSLALLLASRCPTKCSDQKEASLSKRIQKTFNFVSDWSRAIPISADKTNDKSKVNTAYRNSL